MRTFVIQSPGLSVGRPGAVVTAVQLRMDDDKLDQFVEAGYAIEIHGPKPKQADDEVPDTPLDELGSSGQLPDLGVGDSIEPEPEAKPKKPAAKKA